MQQRSEETRENILSTASQLFAKHGYDSTGVAEICEQAGISKGAFYYHFPTKQAVFLVLLENWITQLENGFQIIQQQSDDIPQAILLMAENVEQIIKTTNVQLSLFLEFWTQANRDPEIWRIAISPYRRFEEYFADLIKKGIDEGSINNIDPDLGANVIVSLALGLLVKRILNPNSLDWGSEISQSVVLMLNGFIRRDI